MDWCVEIDTDIPIKFFSFYNYLIYGKFKILFLLIIVLPKTKYFLF